MKYNLPKYCEIACKCCKDEGGPITHLILCKQNGLNQTYLLFEKDIDDVNVKPTSKIITNTSGEVFKQIKQSDTPVTLYDYIWGK